MITVLRVPGTTITRPKPLEDPILSTGSLVLLDFTHPFSAIPNGPVAPGPIPNIAARQAGDLTGGSAVNFYNNWAVEDGISTRTARKGVLLSPQASATVGVYAGFSMDSAIYSYIGNNLAHEFYVSAWFGVARAPVAGAGTTTIAGTLASGYENAVQLTDANAGSGQPTQGSGRRTGALFRDDGATRLYAVAGTGSTATATMQNILARVGPTSAGAVGKVPAIEYLRVYVEDLTASGRTYAQVQQLDDELFTAVTGTGGRYAA